MKDHRNRSRYFHWAAYGAPLLACLLILPAARCVAGEGATAQAQPAAAAQPGITASLDGLAQAYRADVERLASPECAGRRVGEPGCEVAMQYLEARLQAIGVQIPPGQRSYRQGFSVTRGINVTGAPQVTLNGTPLALGQDYAVAAFSGSGKVAPAPLVFAGYGISAPELDWDDYTGIDATGAVVVVMRGEPQEQQEDSRFGGKQPTVYSDMRRKAQNARDHGAVALLLVDNINMNADDTLSAVHPQYSAAGFDIPVLHVRRAALQNVLIGGTGLSFHEMLETIDLTGKPQSAKLGDAAFGIELEVEKDLVTGFNLVGVIEGADAAAKAQYIALGAHYDHLGVGGPESMEPNSYGQVHPGADDDASGTAGVLALASWAAQHKDQLRHSLLICLFSAEEEGLLGAAALVKNPPVPQASIVCLLDMDMIGRLREDKLYLGATGTAAEFPALLAGLPEQFGLNVSEDKSGLGGSDFMAFTRAGIPSLFIFTGPHPEYHTPRDTAGLVNYAGAGKVLDFATGLLQRLDAHDGVLTFLQPPGSAPQEPKPGAPRTVSMGTVPSFDKEAQQPGYLVGDVVPGGPADQAGMKAGDLVVKILDRKIANVYDFMFALQDCQPGQVVPVTVLRDGAELVLQITLAAKGMQQ